MPLYDKRTNVLQTKAAIAVASGQILGPNPYRLGLLISCPVTNRVDVTFGKPAEANSGVTLYPAREPVWMPKAWIGDAITQPIFAIATGGTDVIGISEIILMP